MGSHGIYAWKRAVSLSLYYITSIQPLEQPVKPA